MLAVYWDFATFLSRTTKTRQSEAGAAFVDNNSMMLGRWRRSKDGLRGWFTSSARTIYKRSSM
jgi:hypothetical protein